MLRELSQSVSKNHLCLSHASSPKLSLPNPYFSEPSCPILLHGLMNYPSALHWTNSGKSPLSIVDGTSHMPNEVLRLIPNVDDPEDGALEAFQLEFLQILSSFKNQTQTKYQRLKVPYHQLVVDGTRAIVQDQLRSEIALIDSNLVALYNRRAVGFLDENQEKELRLKIKKKKELEQTLKNKVADQKRAKKSRNEKKAKMIKICEDHPDIRMALKLRSNPAVRSGKQSSSTAYAHGLGFERVLQLPEFDELSKKRKGVVKPVLIFTVDGGPNENPRYQKTIEVDVHHHLQNDLNALFIATNAPERSAINRVERKMAPSSRELSGLIIPHDNFGSPLDDQSITISKQLAEVWSSVVVDGFPTVAEFIQPEKSEIKSENLMTRSQLWFANHVRTNQYFTHIVKYFDIACCSRPRSSYFSLMHSRFLPPPIPIHQSEEKLKAPESRADQENHRLPSLLISLVLKWDDLLPRSTRSFKQLPFDLYCPSV
ncbi:hypothetical protein DAPPUDRAFT_115824 [Daphnia pulex]|uniref:Uncharacterized protein n=1 Tax=Daphnia pulex TaxID=6669 RepID=E9HMN2_DAPPU|nr:hypothetical protein DAPPUDRAFT_115824 [Daphnia pulex]|eukprot:EFX67013.1 hypothetical protein DAPPUDRAFT_115824 [Daphnia pulex]